MDKLVVIDESGTNIALTPRYAWVSTTKRAYGEAPRNWGENVTLLAALTTQGLAAETAISVKGGTTSACFEPYIERFLCPQLQAGQTVIMDNLAAHKSQRIRELIEARQCQLLYLPAYSPDFSPIELAFIKLKEFLRRLAARTQAALEVGLATGLSTITAQDVSGWFAHCGFVKPDQSFCKLL